MKLLIDVNLSPLWIAFLAEREIEAIHWSSVGKRSAPDSEIFDYAAAHGLVVFTHDLDFSALLAERGTQSPSVIQVRSQDVLPSAIGPMVVDAIRASAAYLEAGAIVSVDAARHRIRILPLSDAG